MLFAHDFNKFSSSITQLINSQKRWIIVDNSTLLLDLDGIPFIYPVIAEFSNGTTINRLEEIANNSPRTNYTDMEYATRNIEGDTYIQWNVLSNNPWWRFQTKIDVKTGIMTSLWLEEGFFSIIGPSFSHIYNLSLVSDLPEVEGQSNNNNHSRIKIGLSIVGFIFFTSIIRYKFRKDPS